MITSFKSFNKYVKNIHVCLFLLTILFSLLTNNVAFASPNFTNGNTCWDKAAHKYKLDAWMLLAIGATESAFRTGIEAKNTNKTSDLGLMQVNTIHIPYFRKAGISPQELQYNSCTNIYAAADILRQCINKYGNNIDGVGCYHSQTPSLRRSYGRKVLNKYKELVNTYYYGKANFSFEHYRKENISTSKNKIKNKKSTIFVENTADNYKTYVNYNNSVFQERTNKYSSGLTLTKNK